jgi:hypothetical protein
MQEADLLTPLKRESVWSLEVCVPTVLHPPVHVPLVDEVNVQIVERLLRHVVSMTEGGREQDKQLETSTNNPSDTG